VCTKLQLTRYGGRGYGYISEHFLPVARGMGLSAESEHAIMIDNPARALTFVAPRA
jgi:phosphotriesterase-related protein